LEEPGIRQNGEASARCRGCRGGHFKRQAGCEHDNSGGRNGRDSIGDFHRCFWGYRRIESPSVPVDMGVRTMRAPKFTGMRSDGIDRERRYAPPKSNDRQAELDIQIG
jgi:hypothetical protein